METLLHEVGHHWHWQISSALAHVLLAALANKRLTVSRTMRTLDDYIARAYAAALIRPDNLADSDPEVYDVIMRYAFGGEA